MNGWIKLHRKILLNPIAQRAQYAWLWITLLLKAQHSEEKIMWNKGILVVKEGQLITGRKSLSEETGIPETTIEGILDFLTKEGNIRQQKNNRFRLITIVNWKEYQVRSDNQPTTSRHLADTYKNDKKVKNEKNTTEQSSEHEDLEITPDEDQVPTKSLLRKKGVEVKGYNPALTNELFIWSQEESGVKFLNPIKQKKHIATLLQSGKSVEEVKRAWSNCAADDFWGRNMDWGSVMSFASRVTPQKKRNLISDKK